MGTNKKMPRKNLDYQKLREGDLENVDLENVKPNSNIYKSTQASRLNKDRVSFGTKGKPSKAQLALIERYKADIKRDVVDNTLDGIISEKILEIREVINNMIEYGDTNIFRVLPKELDRKIQSYGLAAQEYFGKKVASLDGMEVYIVPVTYKVCNKCMKYKPLDNFFSSNSDTANGTVHICKDCSRELFDKYFKLYNKDAKESLITVMQKLDIIVYEPALSKFVDYANTAEGKSEILKGSFLGNFIAETTINLKLAGAPEDKLMFVNSNLSGIPFKLEHNTFVMPPIYNDVLADKPESEDDDEENLSKSALRKLVHKWGDVPKEDLLWLENKFKEWDEEYNIEGLSSKKLIIQMCFDELMITRYREQKKDVGKLNKSFIESMKALNLTPKQLEKTDGETKFQSIGEFIRERENTTPIIHKNKDLEDVDGFTRMWESIVGALCRTAGKDNEYVDKFDEYYKEQTVTAKEVTTFGNDGDEDGEDS